MIYTFFCMLVNSYFWKKCPCPPIIITGIWICNTEKLVSFWSHSNSRMLLNIKWQNYQAEKKKNYCFPSSIWCLTVGFLQRVIMETGAPLYQECNKLELSFFGEKVHDILVKIRNSNSAFMLIFKLFCKSFVFQTTSEDLTGSGHTKWWFHKMGGAVGKHLLLPLTPHSHLWWRVISDYCITL